MIGMEKLDTLGSGLLHVAEAIVEGEGGRQLKIVHWGCNQTMTNRGIYIYYFFDK
jgi:hypothetical protein